MQYELGSPTGPRREVSDQVIRPEWVVECLENTVERLSAQVEALRAENERIRTEAQKSKARTLCLKPREILRSTQTRPKTLFVYQQEGKSEYWWAYYSGATECVLFGGMPVGFENSNAALDDAKDVLSNYSDFDIQAVRYQSP